ncbi:MAG: molybdopterin-dependent oxidoreductase [Holophagales bacterium]|nr:molybdopterin-dependent oxidoreductase [Holophagales bacterium]
MDPVAFRLLNALGAGKSTVTGQVLDEHAGRVDLCIRRVADEIGMDPGRERTPYRGKGIACAVKAPAMPNDAASSVVMKFAEDATLEILIAGIDYRQGLMTVVAQFAAEALDIPVETVRVGLPDTDLALRLADGRDPRQTWATGTPSSAGRRRSAGSSATRRRGARRPCLGADAPGAAPSSTGVGAVASLARLVMGYQFADGHAIGGPVAAATSYLPEGLLFLDPHTSQSAKPVAKWTFGAQAVEISVDPETGR